MEEKENFDLAEQIKNKIKELEKLKYIKTMKELEEKLETDLDSQKKKGEDDMTDFQKKRAESDKSFLEKGEEKLKKLKKEQEEKIRKFKEDFENNYPKKNPKDTSEILNLKKRKEFCIKKRNYADAKKLTNEINDLIKKNDSKWLTEDKTKKLDAEIKKLKNKFLVEYNAEKQKLNLKKDEMDLKNDEQEYIMKKQSERRKKNLLAQNELDKIQINSSCKKMAIEY